jgi:septum site-determining protein MinD
MRVIGIISGKGGVGKTTLTANLGLALVKLGKNVAAVDCNVTTSHLGFNFGYQYYPATLNDVLRKESEIKDAINFYNGLKVIPASLELEDLVGVDISELNSHIQNLPDTEIVLLDSAPGFGKEATSVLQSCNEVVFVTVPYYAAVADVIRGSAIASQMGIKPLGIVLNMVSKKPHELSAKDVETVTGLPVISKIPLDQNVQKGLAFGKPVILSNPRSPASREIMRLAANITGENYNLKSSRFSRAYHFLRNLL